MANNETRMPLVWHEDGFRARAHSLQEYRRQLADLQAKILRLEQEQVVSRHQLERARSEGLDSYDADRFRPTYKEFWSEEDGELGFPPPTK